MANPAKAYLQTQVETTTQGELLIMLYEAAIKFLKRAKMEIDKKDYAKKGIYISKAMAIIHELSESLNKEKGGDITPKLSSLYQFCTSQLIKANIRLDTKMIDEVIKILDGLRSAYAQIVPAMDGKNPAATTGATPPPPPGPLTMTPPVAAKPKKAPANAKAPAQSQAQLQMPVPPQAPVPPQTPQAQTEDEKPQQQATDAETPKQTAPKTPPPVAPPTPPTPPKLRTAANAAKFRAANAYTNANR